MSKTRRDFLRKFGGIAGMFSLSALLDPLLAAEAEDKVAGIAHLPPEEVAGDEAFWGWVQQSFTTSPNLINLNNGGVSPQPKQVQDAMIRYYQLCNEAPSYYMWDVLEKGRKNLRRELATLAGCPPENICINRNTTEALATVIFGLDLKKGDEVVLTKEDYPNMINQWKQREKRDGIVLKWVDLPIPMDNTEEIVKKFEAAFTSKTRLVMVTHMINWTGQILPARAIADAAHARGIEVMVDGAHSFAHLDFKIPDLDCDYFGTSLHKWLCAPFGSGMLYVKKEKISKIWPLFSCPEPESDDITKFEHTGTRSFPIEHAIGSAVRFHNVIGTKRKEARLRYLKEYWVKQVIDLPGLTLNTPSDPAFSCGIANFSLEGVTTSDIRTKLLRNYSIHCTTVNWEHIHGVRISPNIYTTLEDLDTLVLAIKTLAEMGQEAGKN